MPFQAMNGFRGLSEIASLLQPVASAHLQTAHFLQQPDEKNLATLRRFLPGCSSSRLANPASFPPATAR